MTSNQISPFEVNPKHTAGARWDRYVRRFDIFLESENVKDDARRKAKLLYLAGEDIYDVYYNQVQSLTVPPGMSEYDFIKNQISSYFTPRRNIEFEIFEFRNLKQDALTKIDEFYTNLLRMTRYCDFTNVEREIKSQIIQNCYNPKIRIYALENPNKALLDIISYARQLEDVETLATQMSASSITPTVNVINTSKVKQGVKSKGPTRTCYNCGKAWPHEKGSKCSSLGKKCNKCGRLNHFASVCKNGNIPKKRNNFLQTEKPAMNLQESELGNANALLHIYSMGNGQKDKYTCPVTINGLRVNMTIDTGCSTTIVNRSTFDKINRQNTLILQPYDVSLVTYTGQQLKPVGKVVVEVVLEKSKTMLPLVVVPGNGPNLLGRNWLDSFRCNIQFNNYIGTDDSIMKLFPVLFSDTSGALKGVTGKINIGADACPKFCKARPLPLLLKPKVEEELARLQKEDIIESVNYSEWATPVVVVEKPSDAVRLCGDYRVTINQVARADKYPLPLIDELYGKLAGGAIFTKLFTKNGNIPKKRNNFLQTEKPAMNLQESELGNANALLHIYSMGNGQKDKYTCPVTINGLRVNMTIDTGCSTTIVNRSTFDKINRQNTLILQPYDVSLVTYTGQQLKPVGKVVVEVVLEKSKTMLPLVVVPGNGPNLLGRNWLDSFRCNIQFNNYIGTDDSIMKLFPVLFSDTSGALKGVTGKINIGADACPKFCKARPLPLLLKPKVEEELARLQKEDIIESVNYSEWATPVVVVEKPSDAVRLCGDYRVTINQVARADKYPLPLIDELYGKLAGGAIFTKLDLSHAYEHVVLDESSQMYTVINTHKGLFKYKRLPYGVSCAPSMFQRIMESLLQNSEMTAVYLDDVIITGRTVKEHDSKLIKVLTILQNAGLRLRREKCEFSKQSLSYLGHIINSEGIRPRKDKIKAIEEAPKPSNVAELRSYLGLLNYYHRFLPKLSSELGPLHRLLQKDVKWEWGRREQHAFQHSKALLQSSDLLVHYDPAKPVRLSCDASPYGIGAVLSHVLPNGEDKPISYASRTLSPSERNYAHI
ncbi:Uncharacterised protein r2_g1367 [Pycnogonum litorale]